MRGEPQTAAAELPVFYRGRQGEAAWPEIEKERYKKVWVNQFLR